MTIITHTPEIPVASQVLKRVFDIALSSLGLIFLWWPILIAALIAWIDTGECGIFCQNRVGRHGKYFRVMKIRTMKTSEVQQTTVTTDCDFRITRFGQFLRKTKIDELPQLFNILIGQMSFVGPRPDVPGFADLLTGEERSILSVRPGITGPATLRYRDEEAMLSRTGEPEAFNREVIFPRKVQMNLDYIRDYSFLGDIRYILRTIFGKR